MSDYYGRSKTKSSRSHKEEVSKTKSRHKHHKKDAAQCEVESKTPPLPMRRSSIEELIKQRESLKNELKKISKHSDSNLDKKFSNSSDKNDKHSKDEYITSSGKRRLNDQDKMHTIKKKVTVKECSPEYNGDYNHSDSEDEENIIERRREERKQLLKRLNISQETKTESKTDINRERPHKSQKIAPDQITTLAKETTDMFSEKDDFTSSNKPDHVTQDNLEENSQLIDNWDDSEGYYNVRVGDEINNNRYTIKSILGQGVFANVVRAQDSANGNTDVAIKIVRNNDLMYRTGLKEIALLKQISGADPDNKYHCVKYLSHFMHKGHLCMVLESLYLDLRCVLKKYGKHHGLNMKALTSYSRQLLVALRLLKKVGIVHADIKPDNILVNEKKNVLKLCDFGSASKVEDNEATPYLVSRFYRAPEIILGIPYRHSVDIWSAACTMYEMATGKIMFTGSSNNKMLKCFMDLKGKFPVKLIRRGKFKDQHFNYNYNFLLHKKDEFSGREKVVEVSNTSISRDLLKELKKSSKNLTENEEVKLLQLKDILDKMLMLDLNQRFSVTDCLKHPFVQEELRKIT